MKSKFCSIYTVLFAVACILIHTGCSENNDDPVPNVYVDFVIYLNQPSNAALNAVGGWVYYSGGSRGIVVYRLSIDTFMAYDRNCTYNPGDANAVVAVDSSGLMVLDSSCGSRFVLIDGSVNQGPATIGLKHYHADYDGLSSVHVYN